MPLRLTIASLAIYQLILLVSHQLSIADGLIPISIMFNIGIIAVALIDWIMKDDFN